MKIDRLLGIVAALQSEGKCTAPQLAQRFEVSRRTISRDIDALCRAGIPIVTEQGSGGGISLMPGFAMDSTVLTRQELSAIFAGLQSIESVTEGGTSARLAERLGRAEGALPEDMWIDLASFYKGDLTQKIGLIRAAIRDGRCISFVYYYGRGVERKLIEPMLVVFRWTGWYVFGWCRQRQDFRLYKLRRLWELEATEEGFERREIPQEKLRFEESMADDFYVTAVYDAAVKYRLVQEWGPDCFEETQDGHVKARLGFSDREKALEWLLGFGNRAQVVEPAEMVEKMRAIAQEMAEIYRNRT